MRVVMFTSNAWLLTFSDNLHAAVGNLEMVHVLPHIPDLFEIPQTPLHCRHVIVWHDKLLPLMDITMFLTGKSNQEHASLTNGETVLGLMAYKPLSGEKQKYGALLMSEVPVRTEVDDQQACSLPTHPKGWAALAISCFEHHDHGHVPILDLSRIYSSVCD